MFRWLNVQELSGLKEIERGERLVALVGYGKWSHQQGLKSYSFQNDILTNKYLHFLSPTASSPQELEETNDETSRYGLGSLLTIVTRMALGERHFQVDYESESYKSEVREWRVDYL